MPLRNAGASAEENFFASSSASSITTFTGAVPKLQFVNRQPQDAAVHRRQPFQRQFSESFSTSLSLASACGHRAFEKLIREFARGIRGARLLPEMLLHVRRLLPRHVPLEKHLQRELA